MNMLQDSALEARVQWLESQVDTLSQLRDEYERAIIEQAEVIERMIADLARSNAELEQFAYVASHDLQAPLRTVSSYVQLLVQRYDDRLDDRARKYTRYAVDGAARMQSLINDLLEFSRIQRTPAQVASVDFGAVTASAVENLQDAIDECGAHIKIQDNLPHVRGDEIQLMRVMQNLVENALRYRRDDEPPILRVSAKENGGMWQISIEDNGQGIEPRFFERIFQVFQRLQTRDRSAGNGIGLSVVKKIIEQSGGRIWLESEPGRGTTFHFTLPASK